MQRLEGVDRGIMRRGDMGFQGRVSGGDRAHFHLERMEEMLDRLYGVGRQLEVPMTDWYGSEGGIVSIEEAAVVQLDLQQGLDRRVEEENRGFTHHDEQGLQPCQRVRLGEL